MSSSRLLSLSLSTILRSRRPSLSPPQLLPLFRRRTLTLSATSSSSVDHGGAEETLTLTVASATLDSTRQHHPWPEWVGFVDGLKNKGYFNGEESGGDEVYREMNVVKDAALSFARDRYDLLRSLPKEDIQKVVECGCPNLLRKAVNSGKRLRAYLQLDEGNVCSSCNLRGSCDRAYVVLKELEGARTVDVVRILLLYALDPLVIDSGEMPPGRSLVPSSARNLLSELILLSDKPPDPALPKPAAIVPQKKERSSYEDDNFSKDVEMKRGDWMCPNCNFLNFARNQRCLKCQENGPTAVGSVDVEMKKGDWTCPECSFMNFARNIKCLKCKAVGPKRVNLEDIEMKKGDWNCPQCGFMNFSSKKACFRCREARPKRQLEPGEWECPSCDFLNYRKNTLCLKCDCQKPKDIANDYEEQIWKRPIKPKDTANDYEEKTWKRPIR